MVELTDTREELESLRVLFDKALGFPSPGVYFGSDVRVVIPAVWDGEGATPLGWTRTTTVVFVADDGKNTLQVPDELVRKLEVAPVDTFTQAERTKFAITLTTLSAKEATVTDKAAVTPVK